MTRESRSTAHTPKHAKGQTVRVGDSEFVRVKKKRRKKMPRWLFVLIIVLASLLVITGTAFGVNYFLGQANLHNAALDDAMKYKDAVKTDEGKTITYKGNTYKYNDGIISIALMGFDRETVADYDPSRTGQADSIMVAAFDTNTGEVTLIMFPRDSMVDVMTYSQDGEYLDTRTLQVCLAYAYGDGQTTSCENVVTSVSRTLYNMPITYYFALDENGVGMLNDAIGGVTLTALETIPRTNIVEGEDVLLMGDNALKYVQYRDTSILESSLMRQARQIQYVQAFFEKGLSLMNGGAGMLLDLFNQVQNNSVTNLEASEVTYLATTAVTNGVSSVDMVSLPGELVQGEVYAEYLLDQEGVYEIILDTYYTKVD